MKKKKIVFFAGRMIMGGVETVLKNLLDELKTHDDLELVVFAQIKEKYFRDWFHMNRDKIKLCDVRLRKKNKRGIVRTARWLLSKTKVDSALAGADMAIDFRNGDYLEFMADFAGKKICWIHGGFDFILNLMDMGRYIQYDKIVCLTDSFLTDFISVFPRHTDKITRIYNTIPHNEIAAKAKSAFAPTGDYFASITRISDDKNIATLILAFDRFWRNNGKPDVNLYIVGDGVKRRHMQNLTNVMESRDNIIFTGQVAEPYGYMRGALASILSSPAEGLPTTLIEGAAAGALNISSDCKSGPREILMDGAAGILFPVGDYGALAQIMSDVYNKKIDRDKLIENGTKGLSRFDAKSVAEQVLEILE